MLSCSKRIFFTRRTGNHGGYVTLCEAATMSAGYCSTHKAAAMFFGRCGINAALGSGIFCAGLAGLSVCAAIPARSGAALPWCCGGNALGHIIWIFVLFITFPVCIFQRHTGLYFCACRPDVLGCGSALLPVLSRLITAAGRHTICRRRAKHIDHGSTARPKNRKCSDR